MHKDSEKHLARPSGGGPALCRDGRSGFFLGAPFSARLFDAVGVAVGSGRTNRDDRSPQRAWIIVSQVAVMLALAGVAFGDPAHWIVWTVAVSLVLGFAGATQDVTIDGWRITAAPPGKQSLMAAFSEAGYRVGTLAAGAGAR